MAQNNQEYLAPLDSSGMTPEQFSQNRLQRSQIEPFNERPFLPRAFTSLMDKIGAGTLELTQAGARGMANIPDVLIRNPINYLQYQATGKNLPTFASLYPQGRFSQNVPQSLLSTAELAGESALSGGLLRAGSLAATEAFPLLSPYRQSILSGDISSLNIPRTTTTGRIGTSFVSSTPRQDIGYGGLSGFGLEMAGEEVGPYTKLAFGAGFPLAGGLTIAAAKNLKPMAINTYNNLTRYYNTDFSPEDVMDQLLINLNLTPEQFIQQMNNLDANNLPIDIRSNTQRYVGEILPVARRLALENKGINVQTGDEAFNRLINFNQNRAVGSRDRIVGSLNDQRITRQESFSRYVDELVQNRDENITQAYEQLRINPQNRANVTIGQFLNKYNESRSSLQSNISQSSLNIARRNQVNQQVRQLRQQGIPEEEITRRRPQLEADAQRNINEDTFYAEYATEIANNLNFNPEMYQFINSRPTLRAAMPDAIKSVVDAYGSSGNFSNVDILQSLKVQIDKQISQKLANNEDVSSLYKLRTQFINLADNIIPNFADARNLVVDRESMITAANMARQFHTNINNATWGGQNYQNAFDDFMGVFNTFNREEKDLFLWGLKDEVLRNIQSRVTPFNSSGKIVTSETDIFNLGSQIYNHYAGSELATIRLRQVLPDADYNNFMKQITQEQQYYELNQLITKAQREGSLDSQLDKESGSGLYKNLTAVMPQIHMSALNRMVDGVRILGRLVNSKRKTELTSQITNAANDLARLLGPNKENSFDAQAITDIVMSGSRRDFENLQREILLNIHNQTYALVGPAGRSLDVAIRNHFMQTIPALGNIDPTLRQELLPAMDGEQPIEVQTMNLSQDQINSLQDVKNENLQDQLSVNARRAYDYAINNGLLR